jgi:uncharacterized protein (TIGR03118 family)
MKCGIKFLKSFSFLSFVLLMLPALTFAQRYKQTNLVSNITGMAPTIDPNLKNPWGLTRSSTTPARPGSPWWIGNNNSGTSTLYNGQDNTIPALVVTVPAPKGAPAGTQSAPTGVVFNGSPTDFLLAPGKQAIFIFATEDGTISGWNPGVDPQNAVREVDNSDGGGADGAVYKGMTSADINGHRFLYVTNFRSGKVEVYDTNFKLAHLGEDAFDPDGDSDHDRDEHGASRIPHGFAPFNIQNIGGTLFVTYAKQDAARHDPVGGDGLGYVELFTPSGKDIGHLEHGDWFNAPWGVVWTTRDFGEFSNAILVGNFRSGWIAAFNGFTHKFIGWVRNPDDSLVKIDGLWSLTFGNDAGAGLANTLFFTAGINNENDGLFGTLTPVNGLDGDEE